MEMRYCEKWSLFYKKDYNCISDKEAYQKHIEGKSYTAVISEHGKEKYIVNISASWVSVYFLDACKRNYLYYSFKKCDEDNLFLVESSYWQYDEKGDMLISTIHFIFFQDGNVIMKEKNEETGEIIQKEGCFSVAENWEKYPEFGSYSNICKEERN